MNCYLHWIHTKLLRYPILVFFRELKIHILSYLSTSKEDFKFKRWSWFILCNIWWLFSDLNGQGMERADLVLIFQVQKSSLGPCVRPLSRLLTLTGKIRVWTIKGVSHEIICIKGKTGYGQIGQVMALMRGSPFQEISMLSLETVWEQVN